MKCSFTPELSPSSLFFYIFTSLSWRLYLTVQLSILINTLMKQINRRYTNCKRVIHRICGVPLVAKVKEFCGITYEFKMHIVVHSRSRFLAPTTLVDLFHQLVGCRKGFWRKFGKGIRKSQVFTVRSLYASSTVIFYKKSDICEWNIFNIVI